MIALHISVGITDGMEGVGGEGGSNCPGCIHTPANLQPGSTCNCSAHDGLLAVDSEGCQALRQAHLSGMRVCTPQHAPLGCLVGPLLEGEGCALCCVGVQGTSSEWSCAHGPALL